MTVFVVMHELDFGAMAIVSRATVLEAVCASYDSAQEFIKQRFKPPIELEKTDPEGLSYRCYDKHVVNAWCDIQNRVYVFEATVI